MANKTYLLLGTNLGDRKKNLEAARMGLCRTAGEITGLSAIYETAAWGITNQPFFWNQVICLETNLPAGDLLIRTLAIEEEQGRRRDQRWGARILDIDILYYADQVIATNTLSVPHPQLANRRFTLVPLAELAPDFLHPVLLKTNLELLERCPDTLSVRWVST